MKIIGNEKGFTVIETLVSFTILMITVAVFYSFLNGYFYKTNEVGESLTAKTLAVKYVEEEANEIILGNTKTGVIYDESVKVKNTNFKIKVDIKDLTEDIAYYNNDNKFYEVKAKVFWKKRNYEVITYVDQDKK